MTKRSQYHTDTTEMAYGGSADGKGYVFCFIGSTITLKG